MAEQRDSLARLLKPKQEYRKWTFEAALTPRERTLWHSQSAPRAASFMTAPTTDLQMMSDA
eukprot:196165-Prorocentrum_lima.AAC.1